MPVLDWARTDLHYRLPNGTEAMYFSAVDFAAFDIFILKRPDAENDYDESMVEEAKKRFEKMSEREAEDLAYNIIVVTQGFIDGVVDGSSGNYKDVFLSFLKKYDNIDKERLRDNLAYFLKRIIPVAEETGMKMAIHPDDPPFPLLGLPRIMSTEADLKWLAETVPSVNNGIALCTGSLSAGSENDIPAMIKKFGNRIHFVHLRSTKRLPNGDFYEAGHLEGDVDLVEVMIQLHKLMLRENRDIPMRPDHGHKMLDDYNRDANPGYPLIGRLKGLAEISGVEKAVKHFLSE
jgi:mannonate dehydratase